MDLVQLNRILATLWEVWFVLLFIGIVVAIMRPSKRSFYAEQGMIPLRDDDEALNPRNRSI